MQDSSFIFCLGEVTKKSNFWGNLYQISVVLKEVKFSSHPFLFDVKEYSAKQRDNATAVLLFFFFFSYASHLLVLGFLYFIEMLFQSIH